MLRKILSTVTLFLALLMAVSACQPAVPQPAPTVPAPVPGTETLVVGDSITWQVVMSGQFPADLVSHTYMGWQAKDVQAKVTEMTNAGTLGRLVIALGTNDANPTWNGGWTQADVDRWNLLLATPVDGVQITVVLPWLEPSANAAHRAEIDEARAWMQTIPNVTFVDWKDYAGTPGVIGADGIHLESNTPEASFPVTQIAVDTRLAAIRAGL